MQQDPQVSGQAGEPGELPTPTFSDKAPSSTSTDADDIVTKVLARLEPMVERKVQSAKDKRLSKIDKLEKALGGRLDLVAELESEGVTIPQEVKTRLEVRDLQDRLSQPAAEPEQPSSAREDGPSTQRTAVNEAVAELQKHNLTPDAAFIELCRGRYTDRASFDLAVSRYILGKVAPTQQTTPPSPATIVQSAVTNAAPVKKSVTELEAAYKKEIAEIAQKQKGDAKIKAITDLKARYRAEGLEVY